MDLEEETPIVETKPFGETSNELGIKWHFKLDPKYNGLVTVFPHEISDSKNVLLAHLDL